MKRAALLLAVLTAVTGGACRRNVEIEKVVTITDVHTGWYDAGIQDGKNKLVPSTSLKLKNVSADATSGVQLLAIFRRANEAEAWGEHFVKAVGNEGLPPGATSRDLVLRSNLGYTGTQPRAQMLRNAEFVDAKVEIFAKQGSRSWVKLAEFGIDRRLLTR